MGYAALRTGMTEQEYLAYERAAVEKHEYVDGEIFAMSGGTMEHSAVAANIIRELGTALFGRGCRVLTSDMRIKIHEDGRYVYPDGSVVCGRPEFTDETRDTLLNPRIIIEVLSDSSEAYDRGDKFASYRSIPSFDDYLIASQKEPRLELFTRQADGSWSLRIHGPGDRVTLSSAGVTIEVDRVYADVFDPERNTR
jgi:Uma2 family endonuclease